MGGKQSFSKLCPNCIQSLYNHQRRSGAQKWRGTFAYIATPYCDFTRFQYSFSAMGACENRNILGDVSIDSATDPSRKWRFRRSLPQLGTALQIMDFVRLSALENRMGELKVRPGQFLYYNSTHFRTSCSTKSEEM